MQMSLHQHPESSRDGTLLASCGLASGVCIRTGLDWRERGEIDFAGGDLEVDRHKPGTNS